MRRCAIILSGCAPDTNLWYNGRMKRRDFILLVASATGCMAANANASASKKGPFAGKFALNPATVRGYKLGLKEQVRLAIAAGYDGLEPWLADVQKAKDSGELRDIKKMCEDANLKLVDGIGFAHLSMPDDAARAKGM